MDLSIVSEQKFFVLRGLGQRPNKHETGGFRVNGIRLFSQSGYRFALLATMSLTLKGRGKNALLKGSYPSYNEGVIGLTGHCLSFYARTGKL